MAEEGLRKLIGRLRDGSIKIAKITDAIYSQYYGNLGYTIQNDIRMQRLCKVEYYENKREILCLYSYIRQLEMIIPAEVIVKIASYLCNPCYKCFRCEKLFLWKMGKADNFCNECTKKHLDYHHPVGRALNQTNHTNSLDLMVGHIRLL